MQTGRRAFQAPESGEPKKESSDTGKMRVNRLVDGRAEPKEHLSRRKISI